MLAPAPGCGGEGATRFPATEPARAGGGGTLSYALAGAVRNLDPLGAANPSERLVSRQVFEPLVATLTGPYGRLRRRQGPALEWHASPDRSVWSFELRPNVRFQDGTPLNAAAVVANAARWRTDAAGREILPELLAADAPRPNLARIILSVPVDDLPRRLADPSLGLVSPAALRSLSPRAGPEELRDAGSGPFELAAEQSPGGIVLERNQRWWGSRIGLGPALDRIEFREVPEEGKRIALLRRGRVRVANGLDKGDAKRLALDPLLSVAGEGRDFIAMERSVRGITAPGPQSLSGVWLTLVGQGG